MNWTIAQKVERVVLLIAVAVLLLDILYWRAG